ncbi:MAG: endonuclease/exonuclease/phosphatase family protein, partial [Phycisphaerae bacterium]
TRAIEEIRLLTWNVEHFMRMFDQVRMPNRSRDRGELFRDEEDLYEVARTLGLPDVDADVVCIQECCSQEMLEHFNKEWLDGRYETIKVFPGNVEGQWLGMLIKPGWKVLEVRDKYHRQRDPEDDPRVRGAKEHGGLAEGNLLFSRGPVFVKLRSPRGNVIWVGTTHVKSKYGNNEAVTRWRIRELQRTREICESLLADGKSDYLAMMGDFNDDFGKDFYERKVGIDAVEVMLQGKGHAKLVSPTRTLAAENDKLSTYHCQIKPPKYRSFIDHVFLSAEAGKRVSKTRVVDNPIAAVASDHYPVLTVLKLPRP